MVEKRIVQVFTAVAIGNRTIGLCSDGTFVEVQFEPTKPNPEDQGHLLTTTRDYKLYVVGIDQRFDAPGPWHHIEEAKRDLEEEDEELPPRKKERWVGKDADGSDIYEEEDEEYDEDYISPDEDDDEDEIALIIVSPCKHDYRVVDKYWNKKKGWVNNRSHASRYFDQDLALSLCKTLRPASSGHQPPRYIEI